MSARASRAGAHLIDFVDIGYVERCDLVVTHFHGQVRPHSLNRVTRQENYL